MNEHRNPTLYADNRFFSSSVSRVFPEEMTAQRSGSGQIRVKSRFHSSTLEPGFWVESPGNNIYG